MSINVNVNVNFTECVNKITETIVSTASNDATILEDMTTYTIKKIAQPLLEFGYSNTASMYMRLFKELPFEIQREFIRDNYTGDIFCHAADNE